MAEWALIILELLVVAVVFYGAIMCPYVLVKVAFVIIGICGLMFTFDMVKETIRG